MKEYRPRGTIRAERIETNKRVGTRNGLVTALAGDYLVYHAAGVSVVNGKVFENEYVEVQGDFNFHAKGNTVEQVVEFLKNNPDQVDRVIREEKAGANRRGIVEYEV